MAGLIVIAALLHVNACEWHWRVHGWTHVVRSEAIVILWIEDPTPDAPVRNGRTAVRHTSLVPDRDASRLAAIVIGVAAPLGLLLTVLCLALGWRARERATRGLCPSCGYDLRAHHAAATSKLQCPECGWQRA